MNFIGIDLHTNRFTCCYRNERSSVDNPQDKRTETFELTGQGLAQFFKTLTEDTYVLIKATITTFRGYDSGESAMPYLFFLLL
jgi:hypothetical protein